MVGTNKSLNFSIPPLKLLQLHGASIQSKMNYLRWSEIFQSETELIYLT